MWPAGETIPRYKQLSHRYRFSSPFVLKKMQRGVTELSTYYYAGTTECLLLLLSQHRSIQYDITYPRYSASITLTLLLHTDYYHMILSYLSVAYPISRNMAASARRWKCGVCGAKAGDLVCSGCVTGEAERRRAGRAERLEALQTVRDSAAVAVQVCSCCCCCCRRFFFHFLHALYLVAYANHFLVLFWYPYFTVCSPEEGCCCPCRRGSLG